MGLILVIAAAISIVTLLVDPNRFKGRIEAAVQDATGYPFKINGNLDIAWYPWLAVRTGAAQLGEGEPLLQWQSARVGAQLIPLIRGRIVISRVRLERLQAHLRRTANGHANWDFWLSHHGQSGGSTGQTPEIGGVEIRDGSLEYLDERDGTSIRVSDWTLDVDEWKSGKPFSLRTRFVLQYGPLSAVRIPIELKAPEIQMQSAPTAISVPRFEWQVADARLSGSIVLKSVEPLRAAGVLGVETASLRKLLSDLGVGGPRPRDAATLGAFRMTTRWTAENDVITVKPIEMQLDQTKLDGELVRSGLSESVWNFNLRGDRIELSRYTQIEDDNSEPFELPTAALKALRMQGTLHFNEAQLADARMKDVRLRLELEDGQLRDATSPPSSIAP